ncbi:hypothetical protein [Marinobacter sp. SS8-8]|uniref:hypothetical protein n=1 Tax=Marinobacter sp. SS8-8 TaxID=3050452 RepID=UPI0026DEEF59|nr:hypothetical protein [Marinobacter sp. SS8-8]|tara:strand:- start:1708 stop:2220 length:513 start_codon:yes stop_codon:yes gene_type:complete
MKINFKFAFPILLAATSALAGSNDEVSAHRYISERIAQYGEAVERCEQVAASRPLPDELVIEHLRGYSIEDVRAFLITRSSLVSGVCEKPELTELAYAIAVLEGADISGTPKEIVQNIKLLVFGESTWALKKKYLELPTSVQNILEQTDYFDKPFDDIAILNAIENGKNP